jgi:hypothetical protein
VVLWAGVECDHQGTCVWSAYESWKILLSAGCALVSRVLMHAFTAMHVPESAVTDDSTLRHRTLVSGNTTHAMARCSIFSAGTTDPLISSTPEGPCQHSASYDACLGCQAPKPQTNSLPADRHH